MVEISPKVILSGGGIGPVPGLLNVEVGAVHVGHVPSVGEHGELGVGAKGSFAHVVSSGVAGNVNAADGVSDCDDASSPALIE
jgi:hypothetical protein